MGSQPFMNEFVDEPLGEQIRVRWMTAPCLHNMWVEDNNMRPHFQSEAAGVTVAVRWVQYLEDSNIPAWGCKETRRQLGRRRAFRQPLTNSNDVPNTSSNFVEDAIRFVYHVVQSQGQEIAFSRSAPTGHSCGCGVQLSEACSGAAL